MAAASPIRTLRPTSTCSASSSSISPLSSFTADAGSVLVCRPCITILECGSSSYPAVALTSGSFYEGSDGASGKAKRSCPCRGAGADHRTVGCFRIDAGRTRLSWRKIGKLENSSRRIGHLVRWFSSSKLRKGHGGGESRCGRNVSCLISDRREGDFGSEKAWKHEYCFVGAGAAGGLLAGGIEHHARLVEEIRRVFAKDRQYLLEAINSPGANSRGGKGGGSSGDGKKQQAWNNWRRGGLLLAVPGVAGLNLSGPQSVLEALGVLAAIVTVHEAGHFVAARLQNIHVTKFAVGFGPTLAKYQQRGVEYSLRAFPFGGFVAFPDDDPNSEFSSDDPDLLKNRPVWDRALVISAGVIANIIFAYSILFAQTVGVGLMERELLPGVMVPEVLGKSAASRAGMRVGDVVVAVDGHQLMGDERGVFELVDTIKKNGGRRITFFVQRGSDIVGVDITPEENRDGTGRIGVQLSPNVKPHRVKANNVADALVKSSREFGRLMMTVLDGLKQVFFNFGKMVDSVSGPVAIVAVGAEVARSDVAGLYQFAAIVNINLAIVNLLPLPALDGGYLAFILLEAVRGKKLPAGVEQGIMSSGVLLLLAVGFVLIVRDTFNLGFVQQML